MYFDVCVPPLLMCSLHSHVQCTFPFYSPVPSVVVTIVTHGHAHTVISTGNESLLVDATLKTTATLLEGEAGTVTLITPTTGRMSLTMEVKGHDREGGGMERKIRAMAVTLKSTWQMLVGRNMKLIKW